jgi:hypothetical protein
MYCGCFYAVSFVLELNFKSVPRKINERVRTSAVQEIKFQNYIL